MSGKPDLSDVTLCAADSIQPELAARALELSLERCRFGDAILFSDRVVEGRFRRVAIDRLKSIEEYSGFVLRRLISHVNTPYTLVVQWDGYVVDPGAWRDEFRTYDYIGAPLYRDGRVVVGNGGFSWRSMKLLRATAALPLVKGIPEDILISETFREHLERDFRVQFAPVDAAQFFSHEFGPPPASATFGFHGIFHFWRYESDEEVARIFSRKPVETVLGINTFALVAE